MAKITQKTRIQKYLTDGAKGPGETTEFLKALTCGKLTFGRALRADRLSVEMSQTELARKARVSRQAISLLEKGRLVPSIELAARLARIFKMSPESYVRYALQAQIDKAGYKHLEVTLRNKSA